MEPRREPRYAAGRVSLRITLERVPPDAPERAFERAVAPTWSRLASSRTLLVGVAERGHGPGVGIAPWTRRGVVQTAERHGLRLQGFDLTAPGAVPSLHAPLGDIPEHEAGHALDLDLPGARRPRRVPVGWFGAHLCLLVPCVFEHHHDVRGDLWLGPAAWAFAALDRFCTTERWPTPELPLALRRGAPVPRRSVLGARLASQVFASTTLVVDAAWWAPVRPSEASAPELLPVGQCLATASEAPDEAWAQRCLAQFDPWIARRLQLERVTASDPGDMIEELGDGREDVWPRATPPRARSLAAQTLRALWSRPVPPSASERRLPPAVPGPLARCWHGEPRLAGPRSLS